MLYSEHIANLAVIAMSVTQTGLELNQDGYPDIGVDFHRTHKVYCQTLRSQYTEISINLFSTTLVDVTDHDSFVESVYLTLFDCLFNPQLMEYDYMNTIIENLSRLVNEYTTWGDWYDVLLYLGYDLPECDWIYNY